MERYSEYKDSGVKWLGEIPSHWEVVSFKRMINIKNGADYKEFETGKSGYPVIGSGGIFAYCDKFVYDGEVVLLGRKGTIDKPLYYKGKFWTVDTMFYGIPYENAICKYLYYQALTIPFKMYATSTAIPSMTQSDLNNNPMCLPSRAEQEVIVRYLDAATSKIDKAIAMQQKMIDLLNERKQIIIQNAVTKGLDENAEMKDSGVEWIGMIPKKWEIEPFGKHFTFGKGLPITKANLQEEGVAVISYGQVHAKYNLGTTLTETLVRYVSPKYLETHPQCLLNKNDFIFADTSEDVEGSGNFAFNDYKDKIFAGYHTVVARPKDLIYPKYYAYLFKSRAWKSQIQSLVNGVKVYSIGKRILKTSTLLIPSESEQKEIVKVLDLKTAAIEKSIENISRQITLLQERKQIIINEVVTGKVKVS